MIYNFNAGPSILPKEVFIKASEAVINYNNTGLSILEMGHRTSEFSAIMEEARALVKELMKLDEEHQVLFLHGGASTQFMQVPMNLLDTKDTAAYADTGVWSSKAIKEAKLFGKVEVVCSSKEKNYSFIPNDFAVPNDAKYFHITTNNTIFGTQMKSFPELDMPIVCDMSSDIFSRVLDFSKFDIIYAGAQKNMGPAGTTLVVVKEEILGKSGRVIPSMLDYEKHIKAESMYNTPAVFPVYASLLTLQWLKKLGGIAAVEKLNDAKAALIYSEIDRNPYFKGAANVEDRSNMNAVFLLENEAHATIFDTLWKEAGISGLPGHRSVGGYRASMYNALPIESVQVLVDVMQDFESKVSGMNF